MSGPSAERVASLLLARHGLTLLSCKNLQTLWAGYGHICAITAQAETDEAAIAVSKLIHHSPKAVIKDTKFPFILKLISPPRVQSNDEGHLRKMLSYEVEQFFYDSIAPRLSDDVRVAKCLASTKRDESGELAGLIAMVMTDLRPEFPVAGGRRAALGLEQISAALEWLGRFHGESRAWVDIEDRSDFVLPPLDEAKRRESGKGGSKTWLNGGYTYLATRRNELASLQEDEDSEWSEAFCTTIKDLGVSIAEAVAELLTPRGRSIETFIHGDVKSENLFSTSAGDKVAFFDFQYVGLGLGVCDLAKLFTCSIPEDLLCYDLDEDLDENVPMNEGERKLLDGYRGSLVRGMKDDWYPWEEFVRHWECALVDWCRFQASWGFWGNTAWLEARVRNILADEEWRQWLRTELEKTRIERP